MAGPTMPSLPQPAAVGPDAQRSSSPHEVRTGEIPPYPVKHSPVYHLGGLGRFGIDTPLSDVPTHSRTPTNTSQSPFFVDLSAEAVTSSSERPLLAGYGEMELPYRPPYIDYKRQVLGPQAPSPFTQRPQIAGRTNVQAVFEQSHVPFKRTISGTGEVVDSPENRVATSPAILGRKTEPYVSTWPYERNSNVNNPVAPTPVGIIPVALPAYQHNASGRLAPVSNNMTYQHDLVIADAPSATNDQGFQIKGAAKRASRRSRRRAAQKAKKAAARAAARESNSTNNAQENKPTNGKKAGNQANEQLSHTRRYNLRSRETN